MNGVLPLAAKGAGCQVLGKKGQVDDPEFRHWRIADQGGFGHG